MSVAGGAGDRAPRWRLPRTRTAANSAPHVRGSAPITADCNTYMKIFVFVLTCAVGCLYCKVERARTTAAGQCPRGKPMVSQIDVAKEAGVSPSTASLALNNNPRVSARTRLHVQSVAERLGYDKISRIIIMQKGPKVFPALEV